MPSLLKRPSKLEKQNLPWSKQNPYSRWYYRGGVFKECIEGPLREIFSDDRTKAELIIREAVTIFEILSSFYHNHFPERKFFAIKYIYLHILKMLKSHGTISSLDEYNILTGTPGMYCKMDNRTLKKWAAEYEEIVLKNLEIISKEYDNILCSFLVLAPEGLKLIKKTD